MYIDSLMITCITILQKEYNVLFIATDDDSTAHDVAWYFVFMQLLVTTRL